MGQSKIHDDGDGDTDADEMRIRIKENVKLELSWKLTPLFFILR